MLRQRNFMFAFYSSCFITGVFGHLVKRQTFQNGFSNQGNNLPNDLQNNFQRPLPSFSQQQLPRQNFQQQFPEPQQQRPNFQLSPQLRQQIKPVQQEQQQIFHEPPSVKQPPLFGSLPQQFANLNQRSELITANGGLRPVQDRRIQQQPFIAFNELHQPINTLDPQQQFGVIQPQQIHFLRQPEFPNLQEQASLGLQSFSFGFQPMQHQQQPFMQHFGDSQATRNSLQFNNLRPSDQIQQSQRFARDFNGQQINQGNGFQQRPNFQGRPQALPPPPPTQSPPTPPPPPPTEQTVPTLPQIEPIATVPLAPQQPPQNQPPDQSASPQPTQEQQAQPQQQQPPEQPSTPQEQQTSPPETNVPPQPDVQPVVPPEQPQPTGQPEATLIQQTPTVEPTPPPPPPPPSPVESTPPPPPPPPQEPNAPQTPPQSLPLSPPPQDPVRQPSPQENVPQPPAPPAPPASPAIRKDAPDVPEEHAQKLLIRVEAELSPANERERILSKLNVTGSQPAADEFINSLRTLSDLQRLDSLSNTQTEPLNRLLNSEIALAVGNWIINEEVAGELALTFGIPRTSATKTMTLTPTDVDEIEIAGNNPTASKKFRVQLRELIWRKADQQYRITSDLLADLSDAILQLLTANGVIRERFGEDIAAYFYRGNKRKIALF